jgi:hypothetical protein
MFAETVQSRGISDFGFRISDFKRPKSIRNPQSAIRNFRRPAITLTEVLISLGILTIGLLGVAALFPVGSYYMQKGEIADRASAIAQAAFNDAIARGMLNPKFWWAYAFNIDTVSTPPKWQANRFDKPVTSAMQQSMGQLKNLYSAPLGGVPNPSGPDEVPINKTGQQALNQEFGSVYVIDPIGASSSAITNGSPSVTFPNQDQAWGIFPFMVQQGWSIFVNNPAYLANASWNPWRMNSPMIRVTLPVPNPAGTNPVNVPMTRPIADQLFSTHDDLAMDIPAQASKPSTQRWEAVDTDGDGKPDLPLARQSRGDYSWLITVSAPSIMARNALANPDFNSYDYDVSVVVFYKRTADVVDDNQSIGDSRDDTSQGETMVSAQVKSTGLSGGELLLTANGAAPDPFNKLKAGEWIFICGPHPQSTDARPMFFAQWYRILSVDRDIQPGDVLGPAATPMKQRYVSLRGPQWPWQPWGNVYSYSALSNDLCAVITPGAVAVHKKSIHLEGNSAWGVQ